MYVTCIYMHKSAFSRVCGDKVHVYFMLLVHVITFQPVYIHCMSIFVHSKCALGDASTVLHCMCRVLSGPKGGRAGVIVKQELCVL